MSQRAGSFRPGVDTPVVVGWYNSVRLGARNPLPNDARNINCSTGRQRQRTSGVVLLPTVS
ncbi:MAG: hypothetical protein WDO68_25150 [Gammaproteobacteria bacterium]